MEKKMRTAIYCRLAYADKAEMDLQERTLRAYAKEQGLKNITVYSDNGNSGMNFDRPSFQRMEKDIQDGLINLVLVKGMACISRNLMDGIEWIRNMACRGIPVKSVNDELADDPAYDIIHQMVQELMAENLA